jgi:hypothetical protein
VDDMAIPDPYSSHRRTPIAQKSKKKHCCNPCRNLLSLHCISFFRGALIQRAEITPFEPDPGSAGEGKKSFFPNNLYVLTPFCGSHPYLEFLKIVLRKSY